MNNTRTGDVVSLSGRKRTAAGNTPEMTLLEALEAVRSEPGKRFNKAVVLLVEDRDPDDGAATFDVVFLNADMRVSEMLAAAECFKAKLLAFLWYTR